MSCYEPSIFFFFFNDTATTEIYTLSLHDALPIWISAGKRLPVKKSGATSRFPPRYGRPLFGISCRSAFSTTLLERRLDRKSTRLNSSHSQISYAVFCLKKKKTLLT